MSKTLVELKGKDHYQVSFEDLDKRTFARVTTILDKTVNKARPLMIWSSGVTVSHIRHLVEECNTIEQLAELLAGKDIWWKAQERHKEITKEEADKGTRVHKIIEQIFRCEIDGQQMDLQIEKDIEKPAQAFLDWKEANDVHPIFLEENVYAILPGQEEVPEDQRIGYAGRMDSLLYVNGKVVVVDIKTSKDIYKDMKFQLAAYEYAFRYTNQEAEWETDGAAILRLDKETGKPDYYYMDRELCQIRFESFATRCLAVNRDNEGDEMEKRKKKEAIKAKKSDLLNGPDPY